LAVLLIDFDVEPGALGVWILAWIMESFEVHVLIHVFVGLVPGMDTPAWLRKSPPNFRSYSQWEPAPI